MVGSPVWCIWQGKSFPDFCYAGFSIDPDGVHESTQEYSNAWAHPEGFRGLLNSTEKAHSSGLIKHKFIFAFNRFSCSAPPIPLSPAVI